MDDEPKEVDTTESTHHNNRKSENTNNHKNHDEDYDKTDTDRTNDLDPSKRFLDTQKMCNSPSANYYKLLISLSHGISRT